MCSFSVLNNIASNIAFWILTQICLNHYFWLRFRSFFITLSFPDYHIPLPTLKKRDTRETNANTTSTPSFSPSSCCSLWFDRNWSDHTTSWWNNWICDGLCIHHWLDVGFLYFLLLGENLICTAIALNISLQQVACQCQISQDMLVHKQYIGYKLVTNWKCHLMFIMQV